MSFEGRYGSSFPDNFPTTEELMDYYDTLCPDEWTDYLYVNILWAAQSSWANADGTLNDTNGIYTIHNYDYREFTAEDTPGSREINVYPFYAESASIFYETIVESPTGHWTQVTSKDEDTNLAPLPTEIYNDTEVRFVRQQYDLSFYSDNELIEDQTVEDIYYEASLEKYLTYTPSEDLAKGRTFLGWCLSTDDTLEDTDEIIMMDEDMTMPAADVYLHAVWEEPKHTVSFDSHGGTEVEDQIVEHGTPATEPDPPTKDGCTFQGWYDEDGVRWSFDQEITEDTELHAVWRPEGSVNYTVKHIVEGETKPFYTTTGTGTSGDTVTDRALGMGDEVYTDYMQQFGEEIYMLPDASVKSLVLKEGEENVIVFYYSLSPTRNYTVHYYRRALLTSVYPDKDSW